MTPFDPERILDQSERLRRLAAAIVGDGQADDVLQDVWVAALDGPSAGSSKSAAWLSRVTRNVAWRRRIGDSRRKMREERAAAPESSAALDDVVSRIEQGHVLERALLDLEEPFRSTLLLRFYDDLSIRSISRRSGRPESTTRTHLQRGLERLRERLRTEQGPDWRAALLPLLRVDSAVPSGAAALTLGGALLTAQFKVLLAISVLVLGWMLHSHYGGVSEAPLVSEPGPSSGQGEPPGLDSETGAPLDAVRVADTGSRAKERDDSASGNSALQSVTSARVLDPTCGLGVPGLPIRVTKDGVVSDLRTDADGRLELPFHLTPEERSAARPVFRAEARLGGTPERVIGLDVDFSSGLDFSSEDSSVDFSLRDCWTAWIRLPDELEPSERASSSAIVLQQFDNGRTSVKSGRYEPIFWRESDAWFVVPVDLNMGESGPSIVKRSLQMSVDARRGYVASMPATATLAGPPVLAEALDLMPRIVRVRSDSSGLPVEGAFVSLRELGRPNSAPVELAAGFTDREGQLEVAAIRSGRMLALMNKKGFEFTMLEVELSEDGGSLDLVLPEVVGKSALTVDVRLPEGPQPSMLAVTIRSLPLGNSEGTEFLEIERDEHGGWSSSAHFEDLPPGECHVIVTTDLPGLGTTEPRLVTLPVERVEIVLATPPAMRPLYLELPEGVRMGDFWLERDGRMQRVAQGAFDGARLAHVAENRPPQSWILACDGYVPVLGSESAWDSEQGGNREDSFVLRPRLQEGRGIVLAVFGGGAPLPGIRVLEAESGVCLATSDARGYALIEDVGDGSRLRLEGDAFQPRDVLLARSSFLRCELLTR